MSSLFRVEHRELHFEVNGNKGFISFEIPNGNGPLDDAEYGCKYLQSQYFDAESDYYQVQFNQPRGYHPTIGWIFPINLLKEAEDFYSDFDDHLLAFMHIGSHKLIDDCISKGLWQRESDTWADFEVSDDLFIFVYRRSLVADTDINNICPSLFMNGFTFVGKQMKPNVDGLPISNYRKAKLAEMRSEGKHCFRVSQIAPVFYNSHLVESLFQGPLSMIENPLLRYFTLYQVIEELISIVYRNKYFDYINCYGNDKKHDLMEKFGELSSEKKLIENVYEGIVKSDEKYNDFIYAAKKLLDNIGEVDFKTNPKFEDYMYKIRNLIVHSMNMLYIHIDEMRVITEIFEYLIVDIMNKTLIEEENDKYLYIIDKKLSKIDNLKAFEETLSTLL